MLKIIKLLKLLKKLKNLQLNQLLKPLKLNLQQAILRKRFQKRLKKRFKLITTGSIGNR
jgi:hypothetical protein